MKYVLIGCLAFFFNTFQLLASESKTQMCLVQYSLLSSYQQQVIQLGTNDADTTLTEEQINNQVQLNMNLIRNTEKLIQSNGCIEEMLAAKKAIELRQFDELKQHPQWAVPSPKYDSVR